MGKLRGTEYKKIEYVADFETNTQEDDCRVWAWGVCPVEDENGFCYGNSIASFMEFVDAHPGRYWFHNLGFDGRFIISHLLSEGYTHVAKNADSGEFETLIDAMGKFYSITWHKSTFADSWKKIPMKLAAVAEAYGMEMTKGDLDYETNRPLGHVISPNELDYLQRDVLILRTAMHERLQMGKKLTTGADCLANYKDLLGKSSYDTLFPRLNTIMDGEIRQAYRGGYVYVSPKHKGTVVGHGGRLDVNSLYPWAMRHNPFPIGYPIRANGVPQTDTHYRVWVAEVTFIATLKPDGIACINIKNNSFYGERDYIESTPVPVTVWVCSVDWEVWNENYAIQVLEWGPYYKFATAESLFDDYIDSGMNGKINAKTKGERLNYKLWLNNLYGKFGTKIDATSKVPQMDKEGVVHYVLGDPDDRDPVYIPVAVFVTAYARRKTINACRAFGERFCYTDTDSVHFIGDTIPDCIEVHDSKLGAWKLEAWFEKAKFLRAKTYAEVVDGVAEFTCAGMTEGIKAVMAFEDFEPGFTTDAARGQTDPKYLDPSIQKLVPKNVPGGVVLVPRPFTIHK